MTETSRKHFLCARCGRAVYEVFFGDMRRRWRCIPCGAVYTERVRELIDVGLSHSDIVLELSGVDRGGTHKKKEDSDMRQDRPWELGSRVGVVAHMVSVKKWVRDTRAICAHTRVVRTDEGVICGKRTLKQGVAQYSPDEGWVFKQTGTVQVYLVAVNYKQILRVRPEDLVYRTNLVAGCVCQPTYP